VSDADAIQFTKDAARAIVEAIPEIKIEHAEPLKLALRNTVTGGRAQVALNKFFQHAAATPQERDAVIARLVKLIRELPGDEEPKIDPSRIVPLIRSVEYVENLRRSAMEQGAKPEGMPLSEPYNDELVVMYGLQEDAGVRMIHASAIIAAGVALNDVRDRAVSNLKQFVPNLEVSGGQGFYMMKAGGFYESSLILMNKFWDAGKLEVQGETIVAIPSREVMIVTGSESAQGLQTMRKMINVAYKYGATPISRALFARRNHRFERFAEA